jgi:bacillithiol system protein YtxJ
MLWHQLTDLSQLTSLINVSKEQSANGLTVLIFKHSTRCSISSMALNRLEAKWIENESIQSYFLDLLNYRDISNEIASSFDIEHASPQVLLIKNGHCFYHNSHNGISYAGIMEAITKQIQ